MPLGRAARILSIFGTRPEAIKMAPVLLALAGADGFESRLCVTGQHRAMLDTVLAEWGIAADHDLDLMSAGQRPVEVFARVAARLPAVLDRERPDMVLIHGDTVTSWAAATIAHLMSVPVGHVEAGLRSEDLRAPHPEEGARRSIDAVADLHFAPTERARATLLAEGRPAAGVIVTGNTAVDALHRVLERLGPVAGSAGGLPRDGRRLVLVTAHRRENHGEGLARIGAALRRLTGRGDVDIVMPVHPSPAVRAGTAGLAGVAGIHLVEPMDHAGLIDLMRRATLVLTDSGGIQEEAPSLAVPVLVLRDVTERPEAISAGCAALVGTDPERIVAAAGRLLDDPAAHAAMARVASPFGDGRAAKRIVAALRGWRERTN